jgi:hypothetical protein
MNTRIKARCNKRKNDVLHLLSHHYSRSQIILKTLLNVKDHLSIMYTTSVSAKAVISKFAVISCYSIAIFMQDK